MDEAISNGNNPSHSELVRSIFFKDDDPNELLPITNAELLEQVFNALTTEVDNNGVNDKYRQLCIDYANTIMKFWGQKYLKGFQSYASQDPDQKTDLTGIEYTVDQNGTEERVTIEVHELDDDYVLLMKSHNKLEDDEFRLTVDFDTSRIDDFMNPITIKSSLESEIATIPERQYELIIRNGIISTFSRTLIHNSLNPNLPYTKDTRTLDNSIFGVQL